jgi:AAHS family 4-hydroxybenzoate transporter-like MFS transporter
MVCTRATVHLTQVLERHLRAMFLVELMALLCLVTFLDGLDSNLASFASPYFREEFGLSPIQTGNVFSSHLLGTVFGGFLFAHLGDRYGRRPAIILATACFGLLTLGFYLVNNYESLLLLRFLNGVPLGGLLPLAFALSVEYAPTTARASVVTTIMVGYSLGTAAGGPLANWLIPLQDWRFAFVVGGAAASASTILLWFRLPESVRFLVSRDRDQQRVNALLRIAAPSAEILLDSQYSDDEIRIQQNFRPSQLFSGPLRKMTPLLWMAYMMSSFTVFFIVNWTPLILESVGFDRNQSASAAAMNSLFGAICGLALMRFTDKFGPGAITLAPVIATGLLVLASLFSQRPSTFLVLSVAASAFLIGGHFGMHSISGLFYPTAFRSNGAGWAISMAKGASVAGPLVGGWLLAINSPPRLLYAVIAICPAIFAVCIYTLGRLSKSGPPLVMLGANAQRSAAANR